MFAPLKKNALLLALLCVLAAGTAIAFTGRLVQQAARPAVRVALSGTVERNRNGVAVEQAAPVRPGETIRWTVTSINQGGGAARDYKAVAHVPTGTAFVAGSAAAEGAAVRYSIDGGNTFSPQPTLEQRQADGTLKRVPAPPTMYTHLRYDWGSPLGPGEQVNAYYQVRVK